MRNIPAWVRRPTLFLLGLVLLEPLRWAVGSAFDEMYEAFGWRWARLGSAMSDAVAPISYLVIAVGLLSVLIWAWRAALLPDAVAMTQDQAASTAPKENPRPKAPAKQNIAGPPIPTINGTSPAYRKAVLQVLSVKSERQAASNKTITSATCRMAVGNMVLQPLEACSVALVSLSCEGRIIAAGETFRPGTFDLGKSQTRGFILAHRDRTDLISNPPHLLRTVEADHALDDGATYELAIELRSQYPHPTLALIALSVPADPDGAVMGRIVSQDVDRS